MAISFLLSAILHGVVIAPLGPTKGGSVKNLSRPIQIQGDFRESTAIAPEAALSASNSGDFSSKSPDAEIHPEAITPEARQSSKGNSIAPSLVSPPIEEIYFKSSELEEQPYPLLVVNPAYPLEANEVVGWVRLLLLIDEEGMLIHKEVIVADPIGTFDAAALAAFQNIPFSPGKRGGKAVKSRMMIKVGFEKIQ